MDLNGTSSVRNKISPQDLSRLDREAGPCGYHGYRFSCLLCLSWLKTGSSKAETNQQKILLVLKIKKYKFVIMPLK